MYSSYWKPKDGRESNILTDHEALHRDEETHRNIQSDEMQLRPLDLETIMSSKAAVKFWYLHRPKTMEYVHRRATKIQSTGRAFAIRSLKNKYGLEYVANLARDDAQKRERERLAELSEEERARAEKENAEYEARVEESRRNRREVAEMEVSDEESLRFQGIWRDEDALRERREAAERENQRIEAEKRRQEELALQKEREEKEREEKERESNRIAIRLAAEAAERERVEEEERIRQEEERMKELLAQRALKEAAEKARIEQELAEKEQNYEESLSKDVPVMIRNHGQGRILNYDRDTESYSVLMEDGLRVTVHSTDVEIDDDRILSPRTVVETPFGVGEIVGLDPHVGVYAVDTDSSEHGGAPVRAFVQILDVQVHQEPIEKAIVEDTSLPIPDEITLVSARIVDSRIVNRTGKKFIQYKLEIKTSNYGTLYCWKRYSTFRTLCDRLHKEAGIKKKDIPDLPPRHILGNFSPKTIGERAEKLNVFLNAAAKAEHLQWGIRVDDQIAVYKRRVKRPNAFARRQ